MEGGGKIGSMHFDNEICGSMVNGKVENRELAF